MAVKIFKCEAFGCIKSIFVCAYLYYYDIYMYIKMYQKYFRLCIPLLFLHIYVY